MTCCRCFKAAQINVWFIEAMPGKKKVGCPRLRIQSLMCNDTKLLVLSGMCCGEPKDGGAGCLMGHGDAVTCHPVK